MPTIVPFDGLRDELEQKKDFVNLLVLVSSILLAFSSTSNGVNQIALLLFVVLIAEYAALTQGIILEHIFYDFLIGATFGALYVLVFNDLNILRGKLIGLTYVVLFGIITVLVLSTRERMKRLLGYLPGK